MIPAYTGKVDNHVSNEQADHAKDAPAGAYQRQACVLKGRAEEVSCSWQLQVRHCSCLACADVAAAHAIAECKRVVCSWQRHFSACGYLFLALV